MISLTSIIDEGTKPVLDIHEAIDMLQKASVLPSCCNMAARASDCSTLVVPTKIGLPFLLYIFISVTAAPHLPAQHVNSFWLYKPALMGWTTHVAADRHSKVIWWRKLCSWSVANLLQIGRQRLGCQFD